MQRTGALIVLGAPPSLPPVWLAWYCILGLSRPPHCSEPVCPHLLSLRPPPPCNVRLCAQPVVPAIDLTQDRRFIARLNPLSRFIVSSTRLWFPNGTVLTRLVGLHLIVVNPLISSSRSQPLLLPSKRAENRIGRSIRTLHPTHSTRRPLSRRKRRSRSKVFFISSYTKRPLQLPVIRLGHNL